MSTHFNKAFIVLGNVLGVFVNYDFSANKLFDFATASYNMEALDTPSNNKDSLYNKSVLHVLQLVDNKELGNNKDGSTSKDGDFF